MDKRTDSQVAEAFSRRCEQARAHLQREMIRAGLLTKDGWRVYETTREGPRGSELVMRPVHTTLMAPDGIECVVSVDEDAGTVDGDCVP